MRSLGLHKLRLFVLIVILGGTCISSHATILGGRESQFLAINGGVYDHQVIEGQIARGLAQRVEGSASREVYKSYHVEVAEVRPGLGRAQISFFGEVTSTFDVDLQGNYSLTSL